MEFLREKRRQLGMSQEELARRSGISARRISAYEHGKRSAPQEVQEALERALARAECNILSVLANRDPGEGWKGESISLLPEWFLQQVPVTPIQASLWNRLALDGAQALSLSPARYGFPQALVNERDWGVGAQPLPCLIWRRGPLHFLVWPRVRVRTSSRAYGLDALALVGRPSQRCWVALEIDGAQNSWDPARSQEVKLSFLRVPAYPRLLEEALRGWFLSNPSTQRIG